MKTRVKGTCRFLYEDADFDLCNGCVFVYDGTYKVLSLKN